MTAFASDSSSFFPNWAYRHPITSSPFCLPASTSEATVADHPVPLRSDSGPIIACTSCTLLSVRNSPALYNASWRRVEYGGAHGSQGEPDGPVGGEVGVFLGTHHPAPRRQGPAVPAGQVPRRAGRRPGDHPGPGALPLRLPRRRVRPDGRAHAGRRRSPASRPATTSGCSSPAPPTRRRTSRAGSPSRRRCATTPGSPRTAWSSAPTPASRSGTPPAGTTYLGRAGGRVRRPVRGGAPRAHLADRARPRERAPAVRAARSPPAPAPGATFPGARGRHGGSGRGPGRTTGDATAASTRQHHHARGPRAASKGRDERSAAPHRHVRAAPVRHVGPRRAPLACRSGGASVVRRWRRPPSPWSSSQRLLRHRIGRGDP